MELRKKLQKHTQEVLLGLAGVVVVGFLILYMFTDGYLQIHSDSAAPLRLALEIQRTGDIFPDNWISSTAIFPMLFAYPIRFALLFTDNYLMAKAIAQMLVTLALVLCLVFACSKCFHNRSWILGIPVLFACFSRNVYYEMLFLQCAYIIEVGLILVSLGCFCWAVGDFENFVIRPGRMALAACALLAACMTGTVGVQSTLLPMLGGMVLLYVQCHGKKESLSQLPNGKTFLGTLVLLLAFGAVGFFLSTKITNLLHIAGNSNVTNLASDFDGIWENIEKLVTGIFFVGGFQPGHALFSLGGILCILRFFLFSLAVVVLPLAALKNSAQASAKMRFVLYFTFLHVAEVLVILVFCGANTYNSCARYLLTSVFLLGMVGVNYAYTHFVEKKTLESWLWSAGTCLLTVAVTVTLWNPGYRAQLEEMKGLTNFLAENNLYYGYATFWNAGNNTVLSNGKVQVNGITHAPNQVDMYRWLTSTEWYEPEYYTGSTFLLLNDGEMDTYVTDTLADTELGEPAQVLKWKDYNILVYDYNIAENYFQRPFDGSLDYAQNLMQHSEAEEQQTDGGIVLEQGQSAVIPGLSLDAGSYTLVVEGQNAENTRVSIFSMESWYDVGVHPLTDGRTEISFTLEDMHDKVEFTFENSAQSSAIIQSVRLYRD